VAGGANGLYPLALMNHATVTPSPHAGAILSQELG
jgi:hypothetical protein